MHMSYPRSQPRKPYEELISDHVRLTVRQHPQQAVVTPENKEKMRKPIDPPPIVQLSVEDPNDQGNNFLVNPFLFMTATLIEDSDDGQSFNPVRGSVLIGQNVSSLHRLKDVDNKDGGFFVFGDISCRKLGKYRLQFNLFEYRKGEEEVIFVDSVISNIFVVVTSKEFRGLMESTHLSRTFSDQGVRLRLRKEPRTLSGSKRGWEASTPETTTSPLHPGVYASQQDHRAYAYGAPIVKRQRSDSEHNVPMYQPHYSGGAISPYSQMPGHSVAWPMQSQQGYQTGMTSTYGGMMNPAHAQAATTPLWQRSSQQASYSAPAVGGNNPFFPSSNITQSISRNPPGEGYGQNYAQPQQYSARSGSDAYHPVHGLHTPTSGSDSGIGAQHQPNFMPPSQDMPANVEKASSTQMLPQSIHSDRTISQYPYHQVSMDAPPVRQPKIDTNHYQDTPHTYSDPSRDAYQPNTSGFPDLHGGLLNRSFAPMPPTQQQSHYGNMHEDELAEFKQQPNSYPTPSQTSPLS